jgi:hypothetical protein
MTRVLVVALSATVLALSSPLGVAVARADGCQGWNGRWFSTSTCDGNGYYGGGGQACTSFSFGPFWSSQCTPIAPPAPSVP